MSSVLVTRILRRRRPRRRRLDWCRERGPHTIVAAFAPRSVQPSNGVFFDRDTSRDATTVTGASGASTVMSATDPAASVPPGRRRIRAGFVERSSMARLQRDSAGVDQPVEDERHARFEPDDAEGRLVELDALFVGVMRRVVGRDRVH